MCLFSRRVHLKNSIRGQLGVIFQTALFNQTCSPPPTTTTTIESNIGLKLHKIPVKEYFSSKRQILIRMCFENLWSCRCTTSAFECPLLPGNFRRERIRCLIIYKSENPCNEWNSQFCGFVK